MKPTKNELVSSRSLRPLWALLVAPLPLASAQTPALQNSPWFATVADTLRRSEYQFGEERSGWSAPNRSQHLRSYIDSNGVTIRDRDEAGGDWQLDLRTVRFGRQDDCVDLDIASTESSGSRVELNHGPLTEWFDNSAGGLEQGWTLLERPRGEGPVRIGVRANDAFTFVVDPGARGGVFVETEGQAELPYRGLVAFDAAGTELSAWLTSVPGGLEVWLDDTEARYPVTVDPVLSGPTWTADSDSPTAEYGFVVTSAGDVNGDGYDDALITAPFFDAGQTDEGRVWIYHGSASGLPTSSSWFAESNQTSALYGYAAAGVGDVNGDGFDDVVVAAPQFDAGETNEGHIWVYHGSPTGLVSFAAWRAESDQAFAYYGRSVSAAGDVNGDGFADFLVGAPSYDDSGANQGRAYLYHGSATGVIPLAAWRTTGASPNTYYADRVSGAGDVNGDGYDDVAVAAPFYDNGQVDEGRVWVFHGSPNGVSPIASFSVESNQAHCWYGFSLAAAGDVNADGYDDLVVGAPYYDETFLDEGRIWVYRGSADGLVAPAFWRKSPEQGGALFGYSVAGGGDANGDGFDDLLVGAPQFDSPFIDTGRVWLHLGSVYGPIDNATWRQSSNQPGSRYGAAVGWAGDVNGDGFDDALVGAPSYDNGQTDEGQAWLFDGSPNAGDSYCTSIINSSGGPAVLSATGSPSAAVGVETVATSVPNTPGLFFHGSTQIMVPFGNGFLCAGGAIKRGNVVIASNNRVSYSWDNLLPFQGTTRNFQYWFRDAAGGTAGFNTSDAVSVMVAP